MHQRLKKALKKVVADADDKKVRLWTSASVMDVVSKQGDGAYDLIFDNEDPKKVAREIFDTLVHDDWGLTDTDDENVCLTISIYRRNPEEI
jgi:predicted O-methyltransferase YrrM